MKRLPPYSNMLAESMRCFDSPTPIGLGTFTRRIYQELRQLSRAISPDINRYPTYNISYRAIDGDIRRGLAAIAGPPGTAFEGGVFFLRVSLPETYPRTPMRMRFLTRMYHPNISSRGEIHAAFLNASDWSPIITVESALISISSLLADPQCGAVCEPDVVEVYETDMPRYEETVRYFVEMYATGQVPECSLEDDDEGDDEGAERALLLLTGKEEQGSMENADASSETSEQNDGAGSDEPAFFSMADGGSGDRE